VKCPNCGRTRGHTLACLRERKRREDHATLASERDGRDAKQLAAEVREVSDFTGMPINEVADVAINNPSLFYIALERMRMSRSMERRTVH